MSRIDERLSQLGLRLPQAPAAPRGVELNFEFVRVAGDLAYVSGHGPIDGSAPTLGLVNCAPGFNAMPLVINGFSDIITELWGDPGRHARSAIGVAELPFDIPVEIEAIVQL
jgi:hypothetical protein